MACSTQAIFLLRERLPQDRLPNDGLPKDRRR